MFCRVLLVGRTLLSQRGGERRQNAGFVGLIREILLRDLVCGKKKRCRPLRNKRDDGRPVSNPGGLEVDETCGMIRIYTLFLVAHRDSAACSVGLEEGPARARGAGYYGV